MKINLKFIAVLILVIFFAPQLGAAQTVTGEMDWGGLHLVTLDESVCTCSGNSHWILDYKTNSLLMLYYQAGQSKLYSNFNTRATYQLGTYSYSSQPCSILIGEYCYDLTNNGTYGMMPGTGTSLSKSGGRLNSLFQPYIASGPTAGSYFAAYNGNGSKVSN